MFRNCLKFLKIIQIKWLCNNKSKDTSRLLKLNFFILIYYSERGHGYIFKHDSRLLEVMRIYKIFKNII